MPERFDIAILGASIAGSTLAARLAASGFNVALVDRRSFPRSKACGEGLSWRGVDALQRAGLGNVLDAAPAFFGYALWIGRGRPISIDDESLGYGVRRNIFDNELFVRATGHSNVTPFIEEVVEDILPDRGIICLRDRQLSARIIVDATGGGSRVRGRSDSRAPRRFGRTYHVSVASAAHLNQVHIIPIGSGELFCTPVSRDQVNVSLLSYCRAAADRPSEAVLQYTISEILTRLDCSGIEFVHASGSALPLARRSTSVGERFLRIGDACEQLDPVGGMGMTHALLSAELAAVAVPQLLEGSRSAGSILQDYADAHAAMVRPLRAFTALTSAAIRSSGRFPLFGRWLAAGFGPRLAQVTHHPECATSIERRALSGIGSVV